MAGPGDGRRHYVARRTSPMPSTTATDRRQVSFVARNHPQQVAERGALDDVDDRRTPADLLAECMELARVAGFDLDVAANNDNAVAPTWYTLNDDGLEGVWSGRVWCNPPYSDIRPWVEKACRSARRCDVIAMLLPANRTEQAWWQDLIEPTRDGSQFRSGWGCQTRVHFLRGRRRFDRPGWTAPAKGDRPPFGLVLVVWRPHA
jgi:phage N-6-adenine-methyltransferase